MKCKSCKKAFGGNNNTPINRTKKNIKPKKLNLVPSTEINDVAINKMITNSNPLLKTQLIKLSRRLFFNLLHDPMLLLIFSKYVGSLTPDWDTWYHNRLFHNPNVGMFNKATEPFEAWSETGFNSKLTESAVPLTMARLMNLLKEIQSVLKLMKQPSNNAKGINPLKGKRTKKKKNKKHKKHKK